ncbi:unnamed protein product, partial [Mesorhabditis spiculigera]
MVTIAGVKMSRSRAHRASACLCEMYNWSIVSGRPRALYAPCIEAAQHNPAQFGISSEELRPLLVTLASIDAQLMHGDALRNCYEQSFGELDDDQKFRDLMKATILEMYTQWEGTAASDQPDKRQLTALTCLAVFYHIHFGGKDKKVVKTLWNSHKKIVTYHLVGDIVWLPCSFMLREIAELGGLVDKKSVQFVLGTKQQLFDDQSPAMINEAHAFAGEAEQWLATFRLQLGVHGKNVERTATDCLKQADQVLRGARLCDSMVRLLKTVVHSDSRERRLAKSDAIKIFEVVYSIKSLARFFAVHWSAIKEICQMAAHQYRLNALLLIDKARANCRETGKMERLAAWNVAAEALLSTDSRTRLLIAGVSFEMGVYKKTLRSVEATQLEQLMNRMDTLGRPRKLLHRVTDCSFLFWEWSLFDIYFDGITEQMPTRREIEGIFAALSDCAALAGKAAHLPERQLLARFQSHIYNAVQKGLLYAMCGDIENDLRVLIHKHLAVGEQDKLQPQKFVFYQELLKKPRLRLYDRVIDVKEFVERYLERTFYNLTVVALHDRHTYTRMAGLAESRYGLQLVDGHLPYFNLGQGLDVIAVVRNLGTFVTGYNYSLNQQIFIEKESTSRSLRTLTAQHAANSLRSHGTGVLNTAVNITYQLLRKKMGIVSQFLAEEHIRAQLQREVRHFEENAESLQRMYPVKRAEKFNRSIAQLGMEEEESYLDKFRQVVTQIGNALGLVRTLSTAAALVASQAKQSDVEEPEETRAEDPTTVTPDILGVVKELLTQVRDQTGKNRSYKTMLIDVFRTGFADETKYSHLENFFAVIPSLSVNYVEHMLTNRERLRKRSQQGKEITFTDDGFVMGIAYLTTVFGQWRQVSALNWFTSVLKRCKDEREKMASGDGESDSGGVRALRAQRLTSYEKEFKLLAYTLQSARIFYFSDADDQHLVT